MKKKKHLLAGLIAVLLVLVAIQVAFFAKYTDGSVNFFNAGGVTSIESMESFQPVLQIPLPAPGGA